MSKETSKFLSLVLRHDPGKVGIVLDSNGWTSVDTLVTNVQRSGFPEFDRATLDAVVENSEKKRFTVSEDGYMIRAAQGHSVEVDLALQPSTPPVILYHGTATTKLASIREHGLVPGNRQQVHLSSDYETAVKVGGRHGRPIVLIVDAARMASEGILFFQADNGVWLTDTVPAGYLSTDQTGNRLPLLKSRHHRFNIVYLRSLVFGPIVARISALGKGFTLRGPDRSVAAVNALSLFSV